MSNTPTLNAKIRKEAGKGVATLRNSGKIPGVLYGFDVENTSVELDYGEFEKIYKGSGESTVIKLDIESNDLKNNNVLIYGVDRNPITDRFIHVDLYAIRMDKKIIINVPLVFEGVAGAVKDLGGTMIRQLDELEVEALPTNIPHEIKIDISKLNTFEDSIKIGDVALPEGVKALQEADTVIVAVESPKAEEDVVEEGAGVEDVKVVGKKEESATDQTETGKEEEGGKKE